jgi:zinc/manganese transport system permease protein
LQGIVISVVIALAATWAGLFIAFYEPYPVSFFITSIVFALYIITIVIEKFYSRMRYSRA